MSPIYTRPIREQAEHDRVIRQLQARYKRKHEVAINPGAERNQAVMVGDLECFPDLVLYSTDRSRKLEGTVEVETGESVHLLEARAEWGVFSKLKAPFYLYVPPQSIESAKRMCEEQQFPVTEIWTYHMALDQVRFTQVYRSPNAPKLSTAPAPKAVVKTKAPVPVKAAVKAEPQSTKPANGKPAAVKAAPVKPMTKPVVKTVTKSAPPAKAALKPVKVVAKPVAKPVAKVAAKPAPKAKPVKPVAKVVAVKKRR